MINFILNLRAIANFALLSAFVFLASCTPATSGITQLTDDYIAFSCHEVPKTEVDNLLANFSNSSVRGQMSGDLEEVREILAHLPDDHIQLLNAEVNNGFYITYENLGSGTQGVTQSGFSPTGPQNGACNWTKIAKPADLKYALLHEIGHCIHSVVGNTDQTLTYHGNNDSIAASYNSGMNRKFELQSMNPPVREYAFQDKYELFAEAYDNFYCSPEANQYLNRTFPDLHQLMDEKFGEPRWASQPSQGGSSGNSNQSIALNLLDNSSIEGGRYTNFLEILVPSNIEQLKLCYGAKESCLQTQASNVAVSVKTTTSTAKLLRTSTPITIQNNSAITIMGYDANNPSNPTVVRSVKFEI